MAEKKMAAEQSYLRTEIGLSREEELLVHCARVDMFGERRVAARDLLAEGLDWDSLLEGAIWHRLLPLVAYHLKSPDLSVFVPQQVKEKLQRLGYQSVARNMWTSATPQTSGSANGPTGARQIAEIRTPTKPIPQSAFVGTDTRDCERVPSSGEPVWDS